MNKSNVLTMDQIRHEVAECAKCKNYVDDIILTRRFGTVSRPDQDIFLIGERPGQAAGESLELTDAEYEERVKKNYYGYFLEKLDLDFNRVYFSNLVKCAAKENRKSTSEETSNCKGFLYQQIKFKSPKVIIACGEPTINELTGKSIRVGKDAGRIINWNGIPMVVSPNPTGAYFKVNQGDIIESIQSSLQSIIGGNPGTKNKVSTVTGYDISKPTGEPSIKKKNMPVPAMDSRMDSYDIVVRKVTEHLIKLGAVSKGVQKTKNGWKLDGEVVNIHPTENPEWFQFNKLRKLEKKGLFHIETFCKDFGLSEQDLRTTGEARYAIWVHCSVGEHTIISIINWLQEQDLR